MPDEINFETLPRTSQAIPILDIVFVHGLGGDRRTTWQRGEETFWPSWLEADFPACRVSLAGYDSTVFANALSGEGASFQDLGLILGDSLLNREPRLPMLLVTHSLGGLVVKQMARQSADSAHKAINEIASSIRGIAFFGTPHQGTGLATSLDIILRRFRSRQTRQLAYGDASLADLNRSFRSWVNRQKVQVISYYETEKTWGVHVVDMVTADPGVNGREPVPVQSNHIELCKPASREAPVYRSMCRFIKDLLDEMRPPTPVQLLAAESPEKPPASPTRALSITPIAGVNFVHFGSAKYKDNGQFSATITFRLMSAMHPFVLLGVEMHYAAPDGCYCLNTDQSIRAGGTKLEQASNVFDLSQPFDCGRGAVVTCERKLYPPLMAQQPADCDAGDVCVRVAVTWDSEPTFVERYFRLGLNGDLLPISRLREPPRLSDTILKRLRETGRITVSELEVAKKLDAVQRYQIVVFPRHKTQAHTVSGAFVDVTDKLQSFYSEIDRRAVELDKAEDGSVSYSQSQMLSQMIVSPFIEDSARLRNSFDENWRSSACVCEV